MFTDLPTEFGFTGEQTDSTNDLVYLRARYMNPRLGIFGSLDPFEGESG
jgi:RHS repeat-associated protein